MVPKPRYAETIMRRDDASEASMMPIVVGSLRKISLRKLNRAVRVIRIVKTEKRSIITRLIQGWP
jgi:hypothetical protein